MIKKIIAGIAIAGLMAGTGCGIGYGIKYNNLKTEYEQNQNQDVSDLLTNIEVYRAQVKELTAENETLKVEIESLKSDNAVLNSQIEGLNTIKSEHETTINNLQKSIDENNTTISNLNAEITSLELQKAELESSNENKTEEIATLNQQISNLQTLSSQLQKTNDINVATITTLNNQIDNLNVQIKELSNQVQNNDSSIIALQNRNAELEATIAYYEQYIASQEDETQVVATFEFDGSVIGINILSKGATTSIADPISTESVIFNGWTVDGQSVDLATYAINTNTKFVADVTYKYNVKFVSNGETVSSTYYLAEDTIVLPDEPIREGYSFDGWTLNGTDIVDPTSYGPSENITFTAKYTKVHTVTFMVADQTVTQKVKNNEYATDPEIIIPEGKIFKGWLYSNNIIDIYNYPIVADTTFIASLTNEYDVVFYNADGTVLQSLKVEEGLTVSQNTTPTKENCIFKGWSTDKTTVIDLTTYSITTNTEFFPVFSLEPVTITYNQPLSISTSDTATSISVNNFTNILPENYIERDLISLTFTITKVKSTLYNSTNNSTQTIEKNCDVTISIKLRNDGSGNFIQDSSQLSYTSVINYADFSPNNVANPNNDKIVLNASKYNSSGRLYNTINLLELNNNTINIEIAKSSKYDFYDTKYSGTLAYKKADIQILDLSLVSITLT